MHTLCLRRYLTCGLTRSLTQSVNQSINRSINQSTNQSLTHSLTRLLTHSLTDHADMRQVGPAVVAACLGIGTPHYGCPGLVELDMCYTSIRPADLLLLARPDALPQLRVLEWCVLAEAWVFTTPPPHRPAEPCRMRTRVKNGRAGVVEPLSVVSSRACVRGMLSSGAFPGLALRRHGWRTRRHPRPHTVYSAEDLQGPPWLPTSPPDSDPSARVVCPNLRAAVQVRTMPRPSIRPCRGHCMLMDAPSP
jgi:hypothetical protein